MSCRELRSSIIKTKIENTTNKREKTKVEIKFGLELNEEQKLCKSRIYNSPISIIEGGAGSGKTTVATITALNLLFKKQRA